MLSPMKSLDERVRNLEERTTEQEDTLQKLDEVVQAQRIQIERLEAGLRHFLVRMKDLSGNAPDTDLADEKPPHY